MEAFIDFSEDELIEDGVLNQGMCGEESSPLGSEAPMGTIAAQQGQGQNIELPKKQFPVGGKERSDGHKVVRHTFKAYQQFLQQQCCEQPPTLEPSHVFVPSPPICRHLSGTGSWGH